jgi:hypothetical protein
VSQSSWLGGAVGIHTILCPVNFTDVARAALEASALAQSFDAELVVVHVCEADEPRISFDVEKEFERWIPGAEEHPL